MFNIIVRKIGKDKPDIFGLKADEFTVLSDEMKEYGIKCISFYYVEDEDLLAEKKITRIQ